jgi:hypothetical protein
LVLVLQIINLLLAAGRSDWNQRVDRLLLLRGTVMIPNKGFEIGSQRPEFEAVDYRRGSSIKASDYAGSELLMLFMAEGCGVCEALVPV